MALCATISKQPYKTTTSLVPPGMHAGPAGTDHSSARYKQEQLLEHYVSPPPMLPLDVPPATSAPRNSLDIALRRREKGAASPDPVTVHVLEAYIQCDGTPIAQWKLGGSGLDDLCRMIGSSMDPCIESTSAWLQGSPLPRYISSYARDISRVHLSQLSCHFSYLLYTARIASSHFSSSLSRRANFQLRVASLSRISQSFRCHTQADCIITGRLEAHHAALCPTLTCCDDCFAFPLTSSLPNRGKRGKLGKESLYSLSEATQYHSRWRMCFCEAGAADISQSASKRTRCRRSLSCWQRGPVWRWKDWRT